MSGALSSLLAFVAIVALIPLALWLLKRTPIGGGAAHGVMRTVAMLPISANQRLLTVEVGTGEDRKWLVLGVTSAGIQTLHTMAPQVLSEAPTVPVPFSNLLARHWPGAQHKRNDKGNDAH